MGFADRLASATGGRGQLAAKAVVAPFIAVTTASARLIEQYCLRNLCSVLLPGSWRSSSNPVYRGYYCFCEADGAVLPAEIVLSTALK